MSKTKKIWTLGSLLIVVVAAIAACALIMHRHQKSKDLALQTRAAAEQKQKQTPAHIDSFNKTKYSQTDPTSIWVVVNKQHPLQPVSYVPPDLVTPSVTTNAPSPAQAQMRAAAAKALEQMIAAGKEAGYALQLQSAYRSYDYQVSLYNGYVSKDGQADADQGSARPGYSEHQTGLAVDISTVHGTCTLEVCYGQTPEGQWLAANAYKFGFLLRYPADKTAITGYEYEPWHFRYIGTDLSQELYTKHIETLEEFFGITGGTTYK